MQIRVFQPADETAVIGLWNDCGLIRPTNDPKKDIIRKSKVNPELFLVGEVGGKIVASVMAGYEGHRGWVNYVSVNPQCRRQGYGRKILAEVERLLRLRGCPKINLQVRATNHEAVKFYESLGFKVDEVISMGKRLEKDSVQPSNR